uniref:NAD(P)H-quinone oxidoreductase subunit 6, chloroplastic n=1 Tax=Riccia fluitans TaxID=41844 RepID=A0A4P8UAB0_9MARC|nr:NADH dehydrogenase subunit 6 [Riccia fluitans]QCR64610.1 NADH dehydrogenase subunit 6 [Riccia fluitans]QYB18425.1 NADH dehydrogenase subunit 6 [Riccia fluitans]WKW95079.1 NADH dehydrogenase subunit 6 [Riccia fluitans]
MKLPESIYETVFIFIESGLVLGSLGIVLFTNIVYSALFLGLVFFCISLLYILLNADFVAAAQILIYVGAINVLIVFAVMLINKKQYSNFFVHWTIGDGVTLTLCTGLFFLLNNFISSTSWSKIFSLTKSNFIVKEVILINTVRRIGSKLLTEFLLPFELMSIILLIALIGAITLARREKNIDLDENDFSNF